MQGIKRGGISFLVEVFEVKDGIQKNKERFANLVKASRKGLDEGQSEAESFRSPVIEDYCKF